MLKLQADGLGDLVAKPEPLGIAAQDAVSAWNFCNGYYPERLPMFVEMHGLPDLELTVYLMSVIRDHGPA